jgi:hypothetical protein
MVPPLQVDPASTRVSVPAPLIDPPENAIAETDRASLTVTVVESIVTELEIPGTT